MATIKHQEKTKESSQMTAPQESVAVSTSKPVTLTVVVLATPEPIKKYPKAKYN